MNRRISSLMAILATSFMATQFSCTTTFGTAVRDAAIDGAASFVEATTTQLLNQWFGSGAEE